MDSARLLSAPLAVTDFDVKFIAQQTSGPGFSNKISITLSTSTLLPAAGTPQIKVCCLTGFTSPESLFLSALSEIELASWDLVSGQLVMRVVQDLQAATSYNLSFFGVNSLVGQDSPTIDINVTQGSTTLVSQKMDKGENQFQPLLINEFIVSKISQSTTFQGALNTITVSFATRTLMQAEAGDLLLVCNLVGTTTETQPSLPIRDEGGTGVNLDLADTGAWTKEMYKINSQSWKPGCLVLQASRTVAKKTYVFSFDLTNQQVGQYAPDISMHLFRKNRFSGFVTVIMDIQMTRAEGNARLFLIQGFVARPYGIQSTSSKSTVNVINTTFEIRASLFPPNVLILSNLIGALLHDEMALRNGIKISTTRPNMTCPNCASLFGNASSGGTAGYAHWNSGTAAATQPLSVFLFAMQEVPPGVYQVSFQIRNPPSAQAAPTLQIEVTSGGHTVVFRSSTTGAPLLDAPLATFGYEFSSIGQSNATAHADNLLTVTLRPWTSLGFKAPPENSPFGSVMYPNSPQILIKNLSGSSATSGNISLIENASAASRCGGPGCVSYFSSHPGGAGVGQAIYNNEHKSLAMFVTRQTDNSTFYTFQVLVTNPIALQQAPNITIETSGYNYHDLEVLHLGKRNAAALLIGGFTVKSIRQLSDGRNLFNTLTISFVSNVDLFPSSIIIVSNLRETSTASNPSLPIYGNGSSLFGAVSAWNQSSGNLSLHLQQPLLQNTLYVLNIDITNPDNFQLAPKIWVEVVGGDTQFPSIRMDTAPGNSAALFISGFSTAFIEQSSPLANQQNILNISFSVNAPLSKTDDSIIVVSGIFNAITPSTSVFLFSNGNTEIFSDGYDSGKGVLIPNGHLTLHINGTIVANQAYNFWISVVNPSHNQISSAIKIRGQGTSSLVDTVMKSPNAKIHGIANGSNPLRVVKPSFEIVVRQTRPIISMNNTIFVVMKSNTNLAFTDGSNVVLRGFENAIAPATVKLTPLQYNRALNLGWNTATAVKASYEQSYRGPCVTGEGPAPSGTVCSFPFEYLGNNFSDCIQTVRGDFFWCSTTAKYSGLWGECVCDASIVGVDNTASTAHFDSGVLSFALLPNKTMVAGLTYQFAFQVQNPAESQSAPLIFIEADGTALYERAPVSSPHLPVVGVLNGSDPMQIETPTFVERKIAQLFPLARYLNTFVVTLMSNVDLRHSDDSTITVSGFEGAEGELSIQLSSPSNGNSGSTLFSNGSDVSETAEYMDGTVKLHLFKNSTMRAFVYYIISFQLMNPQGAREIGPSIKISATGTAHFRIANFVLPSNFLYGVPNGTNPMVRADSNFDVRDISQTSPLADSLNTITITLNPSINLGWSDKSSITISGILNGINPLIAAGSLLSLTGASSSLFSAFANGTRRGTALYTENLLTLFLSENSTMIKGTDYHFSFNLTNPRLNQPPGDVRISALSLAGSGARIAAQRMHANGTILGVVDGAIPLKCVIPSFRSSIVVQSNPIVGLRNIITVSLKANVNVAASENSFVVIAGFKNAVSMRIVTLLQTNTAAANTNTGHLLFGDSGVAGTALFENESLNLTVMLGQTMRAEVVYVFAFELLNPSDSQPNPDIIFSASGTARFDPEIIVGAHLTVIGVVNGSNAMLLVKPTFLVRNIQQSHPFSGYLNTFSCSIMTNVNLASEPRHYLHHTYPGNSVISISSFTDAIGPNTIPLGTTPGGSGADALFSDGTAPSMASYSNGQVTMNFARNKTLVAFVMYVVTFQLRNPMYEQYLTETIISISAEGSANISRARFATANKVLYGIPNGTNPLVLVQTAFATAEITQSTPLTTLVNTLTVALKASFALAWSDRAVITITNILNGVVAGSSLVLGGNGSSLFCSAPLCDSASTGHVLYLNNTLSLYVAENQTVLKDHLYVFSFDIVNPRLNQGEGSVSISAVCSSGSQASIQARRMHMRNATLLGVEHGSNPLLVVIPSFKLRCKMYMMHTCVCGCVCA